MTAENDVVFVNLDGIKCAALLDALSASVYSCRGDHARVVLIRHQIGDRHFQQFFLNHLFSPNKKPPGKPNGKDIKK